MSINQNFTGIYIIEAADKINDAVLFCINYAFSNLYYEDYG